MTTLELIKADALAARKARDTIKATVLTTLIAEVCRDTKEPTENEVAKGVTKFIKNLNKSLEARHSEQTVQELAIVETYVPMTLATDTTDWMIHANEVLTGNNDKVLTEKTIGWYVGQVMKASHGKANPAVVKSHFEDLLHKNAFVRELSGAAE